MVLNLETKQRASYQSDRVARLRWEWLQANGPCVQCGSWDELEVDHIDPTAKVDHRVWTWSPERRSRELEKCQVLCSSCHDKKTWMGRRAGHGTISMYRKGCKCAECKEAKRRTRIQSTRRRDIFS